MARNRPLFSGATTSHKPLPPWVRTKANSSSSSRGQPAGHKGKEMLEGGESAVLGEAEGWQVEEWEEAACLIRFLPPVGGKGGAGRVAMVVVGWAVWRVVG